MFDKFTERAKHVMSLARQEAQRLHSEFIGTEHILLGIVQEDGGVATEVLVRLNIDTHRLRVQIEKLINPSSNPPRLQELPFSPRAKRVIELAGDAASQLGHQVIGTEHLLLGLLKEDEGVAAQVLINLGLKLQAVTDMVLNVLGTSVSDPEISGPDAVDKAGWLLVTKTPCGSVIRRKIVPGYSQFFFSVEHLNGKEEIMILPTPEDRNYIG